MIPKVIIFGTGRTGMSVYFNIKETQVYDVIAFTCNSKKKIGESIFDVKIIAPEEIEKYPYDFILIAAISGRLEIYSQLRQMGVDDDKIVVDFANTINESVLRVLEKDGLSAVNTKRMTLQKSPLYQKVMKQYNEIRLHRFWSDRIGEYIARYIWFLTSTEIQENKNNGILDLFVVSDCIRHNSRLTAIFRRNIDLIDETNVDLWLQILSDFPGKIETSGWDKYSVRANAGIRVYSRDTVQYFSLTPGEKHEGYTKKKNMGLDQPFVCIVSRDAVYLSTSLPLEDCSYHDYRDSDINKLRLAVEYLKTKGIMTVRMGRNVGKSVDFENCIDYAKKYYDELMDIVLMRDCKFYLGDAAGLFTVPMALNRPVALKNVIPLFEVGCGFIPFNPSDIIIFKKYYSKHEKRFLSLTEMAEIDMKVNCCTKGYEDLGIEVVENSAEEILDLTIEMNARLDGEWVDTEEDIDQQKKYQDIYQEWIDRSGLCEYSTFKDYRIGTLFLRKNLFLLGERSLSST